MTEKESPTGSEGVSLCSPDEDLTFKNGLSQSKPVEIPGFGYAHVWLWADSKNKLSEDNHATLAFIEEGNFSFLPAIEANRRDFFYLGVFMGGIKDTNRQIFCKMSFGQGKDKVEFQDVMVYDLPGIDQDELIKAFGEHYAMTVDWQPIGAMGRLPLYFPADAKFLSKIKFTFSTNPTGRFLGHKNIPQQRN